LSGEVALKTILEMTSGRHWVELETQEDADAESILIGTAVSLYFRHDRKDDLDTRWYALRAADSRQSFVTVRIPPADILAGTGGISESPTSRVMACGKHNRDPYPLHGSEIAELSEFVGVPMPPASFPYGRQESAAYAPDENQARGDCPAP
jgi:hypothetical protein